MQIIFPSTKRKGAKSLDSVVNMLMFVTGQTLEDSIQIFQELSLRQGLEDLQMRSNVKYYKNATIYYTMNPLLIDSLQDDYIKKYVHFLDNHCHAVQVGKDDVVLEKMNYMAPSMAILSDERVSI